MILERKSSGTEAQLRTEASEISQVKAQVSHHCESVDGEYVDETILREEGKFWRKNSDTVVDIGDGDCKKEWIEC